MREYQALKEYQIGKRAWLTDDLITHRDAGACTATAGPRTVPVRSGIAGGKAQECCRPPRPSDVLRAGTARAPMGVSSCDPGILAASLVQKLAKNKLIFLLPEFSKRCFLSVVPDN